MLSRERIAPCLAGLLLMLPACNRSVADPAPPPAVSPPATAPAPAAPQDDPRREVLILARGLARSTPEDLATFNRVRLAASRTDPVLCAALFRGNASDAQLVIAFGTLPQSDAQAYLAVTARAMSLGASGDALPPFDEAAMRNGMTAIAESLHGEDFRRFSTAMSGDPATLSDADACFAYQSMTDHALAMPEPSRSAYLRAMITDVAHTLASG